jgi:nitroimidazol reductase NimA-like FMN-containing flavoprotein (pyridoxamine 5'-phosphate oxidase superfamily)
MNQQPDFAAIAKSLIDNNIYMVLGTADETGLPWVSPVYYASSGYTEFYWVSSPDARHSRNIAVRSQISIVIFDSRAPIGTGQGVYMEAEAAELKSADLETGIAVYSQHSLAHGGSVWKTEEVLAPAPYRLYRASATGHWVLGREGHPDRRIQVTI